MRRAPIDWDADRKRRIYAGTIQMLLDRPELPKTQDDARKISDVVAFLSREVMELSVVSPEMAMRRYGEVASAAMDDAPAAATVSE